jgi:hypothetical protein
VAAPANAAAMRVFLRSYADGAAAGGFGYLDDVTMTANCSLGAVGLSARPKPRASAVLMTGRGLEAAPRAVSVR